MVLESGPVSSSNVGPYACTFQYPQCMYPRAWTCGGVLKSHFGPTVVPGNVFIVGGNPNPPELAFGVS